jgi:hypothetical protein
MKIIQLPVLTALLSGEYPTAELLSTVNLTLAPSLLSLPCRARLNCQASTNWISGWRPFHTNLLVFFSQTDFRLTTDNWTVQLVFKITFGVNHLLFKIYLYLRTVMAGLNIYDFEKCNFSRWNFH